MKTQSKVLRTSDCARGSSSNRTSILSKPRQCKSVLGMTVNIEWPSHSPDLRKSVETWKCLSTGNLTQLERICREKWQKIPRCSQLVELYTNRLEALITARAELRVRTLIQCSYFSLVLTTLFLAGRSGSLRPHLAVNWSLVVIQYLIFLRHNTLFKNRWRIKLLKMQLTWMELIG